MKKIRVINFSASFITLAMVDTEATPLWAVLGIFAWFVVSALLVKGLPELRQRQ